MPDETTKSSRMNGTAKRVLLLVSVAALSIGLVLVCCFVPRASTYWAYSTVMMQPFTNAVLGGPFEKHLLKAIPAVHQLRINPGFASAAAAMAWSTNKAPSGTAYPVSAEIRIMALGPTPEEARRAASDAAGRLCTLLQSQYGGRAVVLDRGN